MGWEFKECVILETEDVPVYLGNWRRAQHSSVWQVAAMAAPLYTPSPGRSEMIVLVSVMVWGSGWLILVFNSTWAAQLVSRLEVVATRDTQQPTRTNICQGHPGAQCSLCSTSGIAGLHHHTVTLSHCYTVTPRHSSTYIDLLEMILMLARRLVAVVMWLPDCLCSLCPLFTPQHPRPHWHCRVLMGPTQSPPAPTNTLHQHGANTSITDHTNITESIHSPHCSVPPPGTVATSSLYL